MQKIKDCIRACDFGDNFIDPYIKVALMPWHIYAQTKHVDDYDREKMGDEIPFNEKLGLELPDDPKVWQRDREREREKERERERERARARLIRHANSTAFPNLNFCPFRRRS